MAPLSLVFALFAFNWVALSFSAAADHSILPVEKNLLVKLELLLQTPNPDDKVEVFTMSMTGRVNSTFPLRVEKITSEDKITYVYADDQMATISDRDGCVMSEKPFDLEDAVLWDAVRSIVTSVNQSLEGNTVYDRGLETVAIHQKLNLTIPATYGGSDTLVQYAVTYHLLRPWSVNHIPVENTLAKVLLEAPNDQRLSFTFFEFASLTIGLNDLMIPSQCDVAARSVSEQQTTESAADEEMPAFPLDISADIQVIMPFEKTTFTMQERFSSSRRMSRSTIRSVIPDVLGRVTTYDWYVFGLYQTTYMRTQLKLPFGQETFISEEVQHYFWPETDTCSRVQMGYDVVAGTVGALMLYSAEVPPMYIGSQLVRGIPCRVWSASVSGTRVKWFWADQKRVNFTTDKKPHSTTGVLMRIVVEGRGTSPFYVHHPFLAQGVAFPSENRRHACKWLNPFDRACIGEGEHFKYIYDFFSFVPYVPSNDMEVPSTCMDTRATVGAIPDLTCKSTDTAGVLIFFLLVVIAGILTGGCVVWCRFAPLVRNLQSEVTELASELGRRKASREEQAAS